MIQAMCSLILPTECYEESFLRGAAEFAAQNRLDSTYALHLGYDLQNLKRNFGRFVRDLLALGKGSGGSKGWYVDKVLWLIAGEEYIGQTSIRPLLCTEYLVTYGGHVGYSIRPSRRRCGYGKKILHLALAESRAMKLRRIMVTCDSDNTASRKIIEGNGGQFESALKMDPRAFRAEGRQPQSQVKKLRYWIDLDTGLSRRPPGPSS